MRPGLIVAVLAFALTGCSSASHTATPSSSPSASTLASSSTSPASSSASSRCHTSELAVTDDGAAEGDVTSSAVDGTIVFRNISGRMCTMYGYPGLQRFDSNHQPVPTTVQRDPGVPPIELTLAPQEQATARYTVHTPSEHVRVDTTCYASAPVIGITPPDETDSIEATSQMPPCDPVIVGALRHGKLTWSTAT